MGLLGFLQKIPQDIGGFIGGLTQPHPQPQQQPQRPQQPMQPQVRVAAPMATPKLAVTSGPADATPKPASFLDNAVKAVQSVYHVPVVKDVVDSVAQPVLRGGRALTNLQTTGQLGESGKQFAADVVNTGLNFVPISKAEELIKGGGTLLSKLVEGAKTGAVVGGVGSGVSTAGAGGNAKDIAKSTAEGTVAGAALGTGGAAVVEGGKAAVNAAKPVLTDAVKAVQAKLSPQLVEAASSPTAKPGVHATGSKPPVEKPITPPKPVAQSSTPPQTASLPTPKMSEKISSKETIQPQAKPVKVSTKTFLAETAKTPEFQKGSDEATLRRNLELVSGHHQANVELLKQRLAKTGYAPTDLEAAFHHGEDSTTRLTSVQKGIYTHHVEPVLKATAQAEGRAYDANHMPRFAQDKNSKYEQYVTGNRASASEGSLRKTTSSQKSRVYHTITDPKTGERHLVAISSAKDVTGKTKGPKGVTIIHGDGTTTELGAAKRKLPDQVKNFHDPALRAGLNKIARGLGITHEKVVKINRRPQAAGVSFTGRNHIQTVASSPEDVLLHEIGHQVDEKVGLQHKMFGGSRAHSGPILDKMIAKAKKEGRTDDVKSLKEQKKINTEMRALADARTPGRGKPWAYARKGEEKMAVMFQAHLHAPEIFKKVAPTAYKRFQTILAADKRTAPILDISKAKSLELGSTMVGIKRNAGEFVDKTGKKWNLGEATAKEIEAKTNTRYFKDPISTTSLAHTNATNAKVARDFMDTWKKSADFKDHAMKIEGAGTPPENWRPASSPYFRGYVFDPKTAKLIDEQMGGMSEKPTSVPAHAWDFMNNLGIQLTVFNPFVHGANLMEQAHIAAGNLPGIRTGMGTLDKSLVQIMNPAKRFQMVQDYLRAGGHYETYGANRQTMISEALQKANLPGVNKINAKSMAGIDMTIRSALYDASVRRGMDPAKAVENINTFLGKKAASDRTTQAITVFYHYFVKTLGGAMVQQVRHPIKNIGATTNMALTFAALAAANYGLQQLTGNKAAHARTPGELSLATGLAKVPGELASEQVPSIISSHVAPALNTAVDQLSGRNSFTGKPVITPKQRLEDAFTTLGGGTTAIERATSGNKSVLETLVNQATGISTPHVKGTAAAPNIPAYNTKGATKDTNQAYQGQQAYYKSVDAGRQALAGDQHLLDKYNAYFSRTHNDQGQSVQLSPSERIAAAHDLIGNPALLAAVQKAETSQPAHDPMWDLPAAKLATFLEYQGSYTGDPVRTNLTTVNNWLKPFVQQRQDYYNSQTFSGNSVAAPGTPTYPNFNGQTQKDLAAYDNLTQAQKGAFIQAHPNISVAFDQIAKYTNQMRKAEGAPELKGSPQATPQLQKYIDTYNASDKAQRASIRVSDPTGYQKMIAYFDSADLATINKEGAVDIYKGSPDQTSKQNKAISGLARDIYQNADNTYSIYPAGWMNGYSNSSSGSLFHSAGSKKLPRGSYSFKKGTTLSKLAGRGKFKAPKPKAVKIPKPKKVKVA